MRNELGPSGAFLGLASEVTIAFICTTQSQGVVRKLRDDIDKVCTSGHPVGEIHAFTVEAVPVGTRHQLQEEIEQERSVRLEIHDAESITSRLSTPEGFWIAEQFLSMPAEVRPEVSADSDDLPDEYLERRDRWREDRSPNLTLGDFLDLKSGLRESVHRDIARTDLPFWLGRMRALLASPGLPAHIQQRARYELVVATLRGTRTLRPVDNVAREFLNDSLQETEPAPLEDASTLLMYVNGSIAHGITTIRPAEVRSWNSRLRDRVEHLLQNEVSHRRASFLHTLGFLGIHPLVTDGEAMETPLQGSDVQNTAEDTLESAIVNPQSQEQLRLSDASRALTAWTELVDNLDNTPLFPIYPLADIIQLLLGLWSSSDEWRRLLDLIDEEVERRSGKSAVAERARDRAMTLMANERHLEALEEFHRVKVDWWSGDTVRGSVLAVLLISQLYQNFGLYSAVLRTST